MVNIYYTDNIDRHLFYKRFILQEDIMMARSLRDTGQELISSQDVELTGSLLPKCDELARMADALLGALTRRRQVLLLSKEMHEQILAVSVLQNAPISEIYSFENNQFIFSNKFFSDFLENPQKIKLNITFFLRHICTLFVRFSFDL